MPESILQAYLNEQHIKTDVQENIDSLFKAVKDVKKHLTRRKTKEDIIPFTLVAIDPKVKDTDPVVQKVESIIIKNWAAFKNSVTATKDKSTTYVRAVILESLSQLAKDDVATAVLIWLTARDVIRYYQLGSEENVISGLLQELADKTEKNGQAIWGVNRKLQAKEFKGAEISISKVKAAQIDEVVLTKHLLDANVHLSFSTQAGGGLNPHGLNNHQNWQYFQFMSKNAAKGITEVVNSALAKQDKTLSSISLSIQKSLDGYFAQLQPFFEDLNSSFANSITTNNKRSELLWWKQALYSHSLNTSYRSLNQLNAAVGMALDLVEQVEPMYPESVDYLLRETLKDVHGEKVEEGRLLADWLKDSNDLHEHIKSALNEFALVGDERKPLLGAWANVMKSGETTDFFTKTCIDKKAKLTASDLAVWLFHGLQAQKLATTK